MSEERILKKATREVTVFRQSGGPNSNMMVAAFLIPKSGDLLLGPITTMSYDHRDHQVYHLLNLDPGHFVMLADAEDAILVDEKI